jgi:hypothetical protein
MIPIFGKGNCFQEQSLTVKQCPAFIVFAGTMIWGHEAALQEDDSGTIGLMSTSVHCLKTEYRQKKG